VGIEEFVDLDLDEFQRRSNERLLGLVERHRRAIEDDLGQPVPASVIQDTNGDGSFLVTDDLTVGICGATDEPVEIEPGKAVSVWVWRAGVNPPCPGTASSGTATATFSS